MKVCAKSYRNTSLFQQRSGKSIKTLSSTQLNWRHNIIITMSEDPVQKFERIGGSCRK